MKDRNNKPDKVWVVLKQGGDTYNRYEVSNYGRVWNVENDFEVSQTLRGEPRYKYVNLLSDCGDVRVGRRVHNIMGWSFLGDPPTPKYTVDHIDRNKLHNHLSNLRWASRREQISNRNITIICSDGELLSDKIRSYKCTYNDYCNSVESSLAGLYRKYEDFDLCIKYRQYYLKYGDGWWYETTLESGNTYKLVELCEMFDLDYSDTKKKLISSGLSFEKVIKGYILNLPSDRFTGEVYNNEWYPNMKILVEENGNSSVGVLRDRLSSGMPLHEALTFEYDRADKHRFEIDGFYMTREEHCERLCISYQRITAYINKHGMSFEGAINVPIQRVIKHNINGVTKRNSDWYKQFNIPSRQANRWLNDSKYRNERTFRDVLNKYNINTCAMEIYPCDGDVVMCNNPL